METRLQQAVETAVVWMATIPWPAWLGIGALVFAGVAAATWWRWRPRPLLRSARAQRRFDVRQVQYDPKRFRRRSKNRID